MRSARNGKTCAPPWHCTSRITSSAESIERWGKLQRWPRALLIAHGDLQISWHDEHNLRTLPGIKMHLLRACVGGGPA